MTVKCIDISHYQSGFDFRAYAKSGGLAVICKATEGTTFKDPNYNEFRAAAAGEGLAFSSYHYLQPGDMAAQAKFYVDTADPKTGERIVVDYEEEGIALEQMIEFLQHIHDIDPTLHLTVYSGHTIKEELGSAKNQWLAENTSLWIAQYTKAEAPTWPKGTWPQWSLWQYTDSANVPGYHEGVDADRFNGSDENMMKWFGPAETHKAAPLEAEAAPQTDDTQRFEIVLTGVVSIRKVKK